MDRITRKEFKDRLREKIKNKKILIGAGAGSALTAKILEDNGVDMLFVYSTGRSRMDGTLGAFGNMYANDTDRLSFESIGPVTRAVEHTPIIAGFGAGDPICRAEDLLDKLWNAGFTGFINVPMAGSLPKKDHKTNAEIATFFDDYLDSCNCGVNEEARIFSICNKKDYFSIGYSFRDEDLRRYVAAGVDVIVPHLGKTVGGSEGSKAEELHIEVMMEKLQHMCELAKRENPDVIVLGHGGILSEPSDVAKAIQLTDIDGFIGASSCERIPIEKGMKEVMDELRTIKLTNK